MDIFNLVRGLHIIAVIAWIAGLLMLPRFYAYQTGAQPGGELEAKMITASRSLRAIIITPSMIATWGLGIWLFILHREQDWAGSLSNVPHWFWAKLVLVLGLSGYHGFLVGQGRKLAKGERQHTEKFWRMTGEIPFLIAIIVVLLATTEPF